VVDFRFGTLGSAEAEVHMALPHVVGEPTPDPDGARAADLG
jgi:hypothetical protein